MKTMNHDENRPFGKNPNGTLHEMGTIWALGIWGEKTAEKKKHAVTWNAKYQGLSSKYKSY